MNDAIDQLRYPVGKFSPKDSYSREERETFIRTIENLPVELDALLKNFSPEQWETPYREGGWTARQVVHHIADSHMNGYIRLKWTLTEETPVIKAYDEKLWAETAEVSADPAVSLDLIRSLHAKWVLLFRNIPEQELQKSFVHPETRKHYSIERLLALYGWHSTHHLGHLKIIANR